MTSTPASPSAHIEQFRVYYGDTDAGGIVYHARYFELAERCRSEMLRAAGVPLVGPAGEHYIAHKATIVWMSPAFLDDLLTCETSILSYAGARLKLRQKFKNQRDEPLAEIEIDLVSVNAARRPTRLSKATLDALSRYMAPETNP